MRRPITLLRRRNRQRKAPQRIPRRRHRRPLRMIHMRRQPSLMNLPLPKLCLWSLRPPQHPHCSLRPRFPPQHPFLYLRPRPPPLLLLLRPRSRNKHPHPRQPLPPHPPPRVARPPLPSNNTRRIILLHLPPRPRRKPLRHPLRIMARCPPPHLPRHLLECALCEGALGAPHAVVQGCDLEFAGFEEGG